MCIRSHRLRHVPHGDVDNPVRIDGRVGLVGVAVAPHACRPFVHQLRRIPCLWRSRRALAAAAVAAPGPKAGDMRSVCRTTSAGGQPETDCCPRITNTTRRWDLGVIFRHFPAALEVAPSTLSLPFIRSFSMLETVLGAVVRNGRSQPGHCCDLAVTRDLASCGPTGSRRRVAAPSATTAARLVTGDAMRVLVAEDHERLARGGRGRAPPLRDGRRRGARRRRRSRSSRRQPLRRGGTGPGPSRYAR